MQLPQLLQDGDDGHAGEVLRRYYNLGPHKGAAPFTGARFDTWDSTGSRAKDTDRFTADDLVAVSLLSVEVPASAAIALLDAQRQRFSDLLSSLGPDRDLADETDPWPDDWEGWILWRELLNLPGIGATTASKLLARKRPRLRPIYDSVMAQVTRTDNQWEPMRALLSTNRNLHARLLRLREDVGLPDEVSALRIFDVLAWMEGKGFAAGSPSAYV